MRAIAIETSGRTGSMAVVEGGAVCAEEQFQHGLKNAAQMLPILDRLVRSRGWRPAQIEHIYISIGPGSFTGLRMGVTLAKTLALASGAKIVAVPTARVLAENAPADAKHLIIVLDAKRDQIFTARFARANERWIEAEPPHLDALAAMLARAPRPVYLLGEGIPYHESFIPADGQIHRSSEESWRARASVVALLGMEMAGRGEFSDAFALTPAYIRRPEAEEKLDG